MNELRDYFTRRILEPLHEWQTEANTNKEFYLGEKEFEYVKTLTGDEPLFYEADTSEGCTKFQAQDKRHC